MKIGNLFAGFGTHHKPQKPKHPQTPVAKSPKPDAKFEPGKSCPVLNNAPELCSQHVRLSRIIGPGYGTGELLVRRAGAHYEIIAAWLPGRVDQAMLIGEDYRVFEFKLPVHKVSHVGEPIMLDPLSNVDAHGFRVCRISVNAVSGCKYRIYGLEWDRSGKALQPLLMVGEPMSPWMQYDEKSVSLRTEVHGIYRALQRFTKVKTADKLSETVDHNELTRIKLYGDNSAAVVKPKFVKQHVHPVHFDTKYAWPPISYGPSRPTHEAKPYVKKPARRRNERTVQTLAEVEYYVIKGERMPARVLASHHRALMEQA